MKTHDLLPLWDARRGDPATPLLCLPHAGGGASSLRRLAAAAPPGLDPQPIQLPGREGLAGMPLLNDAAALVDTLGEGLAPVLDRPYALFGHSMGALIAAELTAWLERHGRRAPDLLVVSSCAGDFRPDRLAHSDVTDDELVATLIDLGGTAQEVLYDPEMRAFVLEIMRNDMRLVRDYRPGYTRLGVPILAIGGDADADVPVDALSAWRERTTADCRVAVLPGGHFAVLESPETALDAVTRALRPAPPPADPADILLDILRVRLDNPDIGLDDDFYAAGGDSLIALGVVADAKARGLALSLRDLLTSPNIRELVESLPAGPLAVSGGPGADTPFEGLSPADRALVPGGVEDAYPASALQAGLIFLCELADDPSLYHDLIGMRVRAPFEEPRFGAALGTVVARHAALRGSFDLATFSTAVQLIWPRVEPPLRVETAPDDAAADWLVAQWRNHQLATGIDWASAPMFRCHVVVLPEEFRLTVAVHHAIIDGWSYSRFLVELLTCYDAELTGRTAHLPAVPAYGHRDFVALERAASASAEAAAFWRAEADVPPLLPGRPLGDAADLTERRTIRLDAPRLRETAGAVGVPLKSLLLGMHGWTLGMAAGRRDDVVTGLVVNGRPEYEGGDALIGLFLNMVPVRLRTATGGWAEVARHAWDAERVLADHRRFPLSRIEQDLGRPAFDVSFNFTQFHAYGQLAGLERVSADGWWAYDKASIPLMVDVMINAPEFGTGVVVAFDPDRVPADLVDGYVAALETTLRAGISGAAGTMRTEVV